MTNSLIIKINYETEGECSLTKEQINELLFQWIELPSVILSEEIDGTNDWTINIPSYERYRDEKEKDNS